MKKAQTGRFQGLELTLKSIPGARAVRVVHPSDKRIDEHEHDWLCISVYVLGSYTELYEGGRAAIAGPAVVVHPPGETHANCVDDIGLESFGILIDPSLLRGAGLCIKPSGVRCWTGGPAAVAARELAKAWARGAFSEEQLVKKTAGFLYEAMRTEEICRPSWLDHVLHALDIDNPPATTSLAKQLELHPAWLARAYRSAMGEGVVETLRRKRVERAVSLLRNTDWPAAEVAVEAGFSDQPHMIRSFRKVLGRTPGEVRAERDLLAPFSVPSARASADLAGSAPGFQESGKPVGHRAYAF